MDTAWDAVVSLDGSPGSRPAAANRPISDLVGYLVAQSSRLPAARAESLEQLAEDVRRVEWERPEGVTELAFHAMGLGPRRGTPAPNFFGSRHLVVSPFIDDVGLSKIVGESADVCVVSRPEQLDRLQPESLETLQAALCVSGLADLGDTDDISVDGPASLHGLHAKVIVVEWDRRAYLYLGSMNATDAALSRNVEFMVELQGGRKQFGIDSLLGANSEFRTILEPYEASGGEHETTEELEALELENLLRRLAEKEFEVRPVLVEDGTYSLLLSGPPVDHEAAIQLGFAPLSQPGLERSAEAGVQVRIEFPKLALADLGPFVIVRAARGQLERSAVVRATLVDDPPDRLDAVLARQVDTPEKLMRFLMLILGLDRLDIEAIIEQGASDTSWTFGGAASGLLELVVRSLSNNLAGLRQIDRLLTRLGATEAGRQLFPAGLEQLWSAVRPLLVDEASEEAE